MLLLLSHKAMPDFIFMASGPMANRWGNNGNSDRLYFLGLPNHCRWWLQPWNYEVFAPWKKNYDKPRHNIQKQRHHFADKGLYSQSYGFSSSHVWMWELDCEENWALKNWCFWTVMLEKTLESPLDSKESKQSTLKEINPQYLFAGLMLKQKLQYFGHLMWRTNSLVETWCWERKKVGEEVNRGWDGWMTLWLSQTLGDSEGQGSPACISPWVPKSWTQPSDWTTRL